jgi:hypothetical protein
LELAKALEINRPFSSARLSLEPVQEVKLIVLIHALDTTIRSA